MKNRGITLIALVVTIIVLIILAGVSINLILGDNGIITKAKIAREQTEEAKIKEEESFNSVIDDMEYYIEPKAPYDTPYIPNGFEHTEGTWNNGYTIKGITENRNDEFVWVPCVLNQNKVKEGDTVVTFGYVTNNDAYMWNLILAEGGKIEEIDSSAEEIRKSVEKYGGFYVAKYEAGIEGTTANDLLGTLTVADGSIKPLSQEGKGVWNTITRADAITVSKAMINLTNTGVKSTLISGEAWDTTLQWIVNASDNKNNEPNKNYDINSKGKGWYNDVSSGRLHTTGYYAVNNIYDMAGNAWEWTTQNVITDNIGKMVFRGGPYGYSGVDYPAACCQYNNTNRSSAITFRVLLYK